MTTNITTNSTPTPAAPPAAPPEATAGRPAKSAGADAELVARLRGGDERAFEQLVREHGPRMLAVARRFLPCPQDCADAVQEAFVSAFQSIDRFDGDSSLSTWLHRITVNACLMLLRSRRRRGGPALSLDDLLPQFDASGHHAVPVPAADETFARAAAAEGRSHVRACIDRLPDAYRTVLLLRDIEELDTQQTARALGITPANVKIRLHRARQLLRGLLASTGPALLCA